MTEVFFCLAIGEKLPPWRLWSRDLPAERSVFQWSDFLQMYELTHYYTWQIVFLLWSVCLEERVKRRSSQEQTLKHLPSVLDSKLTAIVRCPEVLQNLPISVSALLILFHRVEFKLISWRFHISSKCKLLLYPYFPAVFHYTCTVNNCIPR